MTYDYECPHCNHVFEVQRPVSECEKVTKCPKCRKKARRLYTVGGVHGVEGGWRLRKGNASGNKD